MATNGTESTPLINTAASPKPYYFLAGRRDSTDGESLERLPVGSTEEEFASRPVLSHHSTSKRDASRNQGFLAKLFGKRNKRIRSPSQSIKSNKAAIKVEPKVFFSNERTFLAWLHTSVLLAGASIAITSFSEGDLLSQLYGIILLPVAISFLVYAMHQYGKRSKMIRTTAPGPYEDIVGPSVLAIVLICSIIAQFSIKLYSVLE